MHHFHNRQQDPHAGHVATTPQLRQSFSWGSGHQATENLIAPDSKILVTF